MYVVKTGYRLRLLPGELSETAIVYYYFFKIG